MGWDGFFLFPSAGRRIGFEESGVEYGWFHDRLFYSFDAGIVIIVVFESIDFFSKISGFTFKRTSRRPSNQE